MQHLVDNRYRVVKPLGSGGMAEVYLAHDDVLDRDVALKVMSGRYADDDEFVERFKREAQSAAALSHPNIVSIYDRGESEDGTYYIAMEYLPGGTLKDRILKKGALPPRTAAAVACQIAEALQAAHKSGVIHRDIKPHNILITESGDLKVTDFGIARAASSSTMTKTGSILGTAHYISPEQAMGEPVGPASDLYSLGVVLYEMLTGELPYDADTPIGIAMKHVNGHLRPPKEVNPNIPDGINAVAVRLLSKDPLDRYGSAAELIDDLERVMVGTPPSSATTQLMATRVAPAAAATTAVGPAYRPPRPVQSRRKKRRGPWALLLVLLALALLAPIAWAAGLFDSPQEEQPSAPPQIAVPELVDMDLAEARDRYGDDFEIVEDGREDSEQPVGTILEQDPSGGEAERGSEIAVVVSGRQVADVPDVSGEERDDATSALEDAGFEVAVEEEESSEEEAGRVLEQSPEGGSTEEVGSEVKITVGTGPATVEVPDIPYGYTAEEARAMLEDAGLALGGQSRAPNNEIPEGGVIDQNPRPGEEVEEGSAVDIVLSSGPEQVSVPNVVGQDVDTARQAMLDAGLGYESAGAESDEPAGTVVSTNPAGGSSVDAGTFVFITYSLGPPEPEPAPEPAPAPTPTREPAPTRDRDTQPRDEPRAEPRQNDGGGAADAAAAARRDAREERRD